MKPHLLTITCAAIADAAGTHAAPGATLLQLDAQQDVTRILSVGPPEKVASQARQLGIDSSSTDYPHERVELPDSVLIPGLVNAHAHLDLTHVARTDPAMHPNFVDWIGHIRSQRLESDQQIAHSTALGVTKSLFGGTVAVGDTAGVGNLTPWRVRADSPLGGVTFVEFFGIGPRRFAMLERVMESIEAQGVLGDPTLRLSPHAANTVEPEVYRHATELLKAHWTGDGGMGGGGGGMTHLAESPAERVFVAQAAGPMRSLLETLGLWEDRLLSVFGQGRHPVAHLADVLAAQPMLVAHVNDATDEAIEILARTGTSVAYCPRTSSYFGMEQHFGPHRYRDMLAAGVNVCLGTDSEASLPHDDDEATQKRLSVLDEMRLLHRRDGTDPQTLLQMATVNGARALGLNPETFTFAQGASSDGGLAGLVAVDVDGPSEGRKSGLGGVGGAIEAVLRSDEPARLVLCGGNFYGQTGYDA